MSAKLVFLAGVLGVCGYVGYTVSKHDPTIFAYPKDQVEAMLVDAKTTLPRRDGGGEIQIWSTGRSEKGVKLNMRYASWAPLLDCEAVITTIAPNQSRVVPDCGNSPGDSAMRRTQDELRIPMFEEHIQATLNRRAFNRAMVDQKEQAAVFKNLGGMQREALQSAEDARRSQTAR
jgi:hypothetical protein